MREQWGSHFGCIMAIASSSIGLGTLWKVPYIAGMYGGSAFFLAYIGCILLVGLPMLICELSIGHHTQRGPIPSFSILGSSSWKAVGWLSVLASFCIMSYYSVLAGWGLNYFFLSLNQFWESKSPEQISEVFTTLTSSGDISLFWHFCFTFLASTIVFRGVRRGIESWTRIGTSLLLLLLLILFIISLTLPGFSEASSFLLSFDFSKLTPAGLLEALGLALFTLSLGQGIMITYGSYTKEEDLPKTALLVVMMVILGSLLSAFSIFPALFTFHASPQNGLGLVFQTIPALFAPLPGALFFSSLFFLLFVCSALGASLALLEVMIATLIDLYHWTRKKAAVAVGIAVFFFGIPSALGRSGWLFARWPDLFGHPFLETLDRTVSSWLLPIVTLSICIFAGHVLPKQLLKKEFSTHSMLAFLFPFWYFLLRYLAPISIVMVLLHRSGCIHYERWAQMLSFFSLLEFE